MIKKVTVLGSEINPDVNYVALKARSSTSEKLGRFFQ